jgi:hypothetical protein
MKKNKTMFLKTHKTDKQKSKKTSICKNSYLARNLRLTPSVSLPSFAMAKEQTSYGNLKTKQQNDKISLKKIKTKS